MVLLNYHDAPVIKKYYMSTASFENVVDRIGDKPTSMTEILDNEGIPFSDDALLDDGGNRIEVECTCNVKNSQEAARVVALAREHGYGIMPIGSLTSAVGAFKAGAMHGLNGWIGLKISGSGTIDEFEKVEIDGNKYEAIPILNGGGRILKSKSPSVPHRVQVWAGAIPDDIDKELVSHLGKGHSIYLDLTTRDQALIGAVVATGGQGPVRADAGFNLHGLIVIDGDGKVEHLEGDEAKKQVGLGGLAGAISEVDMEVVREQPYEFGFFIPFKGDLKEGLTKAFPSFVSSVGKFTEFDRVNPNGMVGGDMLIGRNDGKLLIKGFEIVTRKGLSAAYDVMQASSDPATGAVGSMLQYMRENGCEVGFMMNGRTSMPRTQFEEYLAPLYDANGETNGGTEDDFVHALKEYVNSGFLPKDSDGNVDGIIPFDDSQMPEFRKAREGIAVAARESKKEGPTKSTDLNLRVSTSDPEQIQVAYEKIWAIYHSYVTDLSGRDAQIYIYGHNYPGNQSEKVGGGVDAHIRVTFPLKEQDHQSRAAENMAYLGSRLPKMYEELIALDGQFGITVVPGEKGIVSSPEIARHIESTDPKRAAEVFDYMEQHGGDTFSGRNEKFQLHSRPVRMKKGLLNYFAVDGAVDENSPLRQKLAKSITLWAQNSHRSPEAMRVFHEVLGLMREYFHLDLDERIFYSESIEKAIHIAVLSFTDFKAGGKSCDLRGGFEGKNLSGVSTVIVEDPQLLDDPRLDGMRKILVMKGKEALTDDVRRKADSVIYGAEAFGTGGEMGITITSMAGVKHASNLRKAGNNVGYVHAYPDLNNSPHSTIETPKMPVIAELGIELAQIMGQGRNLSEEANAKRLKKQKEFTTFNPGPSQIHPDIIKQAVEIDNWASALKGGEVSDRVTAVDAVKDKLREFLQLPSDYEIFFVGSATQAMESIVESLGLDHSIVLNMGAFGDRQQSVVSKFSKSGSVVRPVQMRMGTGPNSRLKSIVEEIKRNQPQSLRGVAAGFFMTAHETSTGVQADVSELTKRLSPEMLKIVDGTSEIGAVRRNFDNMDIYYGSFQKFFGVLSGVGVVIVSPRAMERARSVAEGRDFGMDKKKRVSKPDTLPRTPKYRTLADMEKEAENGKFHNLRGILQLGVALDDFITRGGIEQISFETREKIRILSDILLADDVAGEQIGRFVSDLGGFIKGGDGFSALPELERDLISSLHKALQHVGVTKPKDGVPRHLRHAVHDPRDRSQVMLHATVLDRDQGDVRRRSSDTAELGGGYGAYGAETLRFFASPNIPVDVVRSIAEKLAKIIDESLPVNPNRPLVSGKREER